jgi:hypothetical protein
VLRPLNFDVTPPTVVRHQPFSRSAAMHYAKPVNAVAIAWLTCALFETAYAGPYADDMAKCLVKSTSPADRTAFIRWLFASLALHPDVASMASVTPQQRGQINKAAGVLIQRLLLKSCRSDTQTAVKNEGPQTIQYAFQIFGQVATRQLFTDPHVADGMKALAATMDEAKLKALVSEATTK